MFLFLAPLSPNLPTGEEFAVAVRATDVVAHFPLGQRPQHMSCPVVAAWIKAGKIQRLAIPFGLRDSQNSSVFSVYCADSKFTPLHENCVCHGRGGSAGGGFLFPSPN
jgi:hypothetical protein